MFGKDPSRTSTEFKRRSRQFKVSVQTSGECRPRANLRTTRRTRNRTACRSARSQFRLASRRMPDGENFNAALCWIHSLDAVASGECMSDVVIACRFVCRRTEGLCRRQSRPADNFSHHFSSRSRILRREIVTNSRQVEACSFGPFHLSAEQGSCGDRCCVTTHLGKLSRSSSRSHERVKQAFRSVVAAIFLSHIFL